MMLADFFLQGGTCKFCPIVLDAFQCNDCISSYQYLGLGLSSPPLVHSSLMGELLLFCSSSPQVIEFSFFIRTVLERLNGYMQLRIASSVFSNYARVIITAEGKTVRRCFSFCDMSVCG